jgi:hypothetical protein
MEFFSRKPEVIQAICSSTGYCDEEGTFSEVVEVAVGVALEGNFKSLSSLAESS